MFLLWDLLRLRRKDVAIRYATLFVRGAVRFSFAIRCKPEFLGRFPQLPRRHRQIGWGKWLSFAKAPTISPACLEIPRSLANPPCVATRLPCNGAPISTVPGITYILAGATHRDKGAYIMWTGSSYAHLHDARTVRQITDPSAIDSDYCAPACDFVTPESALNNVTSTRRFCCRSSRVFCSLSGLSFPNPTICIR
jgi:hypothetical protein